ncbi:hypothetical protein [Methylobacterium sp. J-070]|uniref:hypothetical protein n=1 Tax=Methylobacterium sp. J-070 TaxID=2836650 RepID=UPI001FB953E9|nr:hypothetical protein [Methylobacterium sp. J-070]MCJ2052567.1 hypothetical protein [Methylobacterium sp. J-070]
MKRQERIVLDLGFRVMRWIFGEAPSFSESRQPPFGTMLDGLQWGAKKRGASPLSRRQAAGPFVPNASLSSRSEDLCPRRSIPGDLMAGPDRHRGRQDNDGTI